MEAMEEDLADPETDKELGLKQKDHPAALALGLGQAEGVGVRSRSLAQSCKVRSRAHRNHLS